MQAAQAEATDVQTKKLRGNRQNDAGIADPLTVTVKQACRLSGLGSTSIWRFLKDGRLKAVRIGRRRTLVDYASLARLLAPPATPETPPPLRRPRGRPRKYPIAAAQLQA